jgi:hypothetical protein
MSWPKPPHLSFGEPFPAEAGPGSPGAPFEPKSSRLSRIPAWAEALAVHRSVFRVRPKPFRFTCPEAPSAEAGRSLPAGKPVSRGWQPSRLDPLRAEALPVLLPKHVSAGADPFFRFGSPSKLAPRRFSFGGPVKPKLRVAPGLLHEACRPCKSMGQARSVRMAAASSAALP